MRWFGLERCHFTRERQVFIGVNCEKSSSNIMYVGSVGAKYHCQRMCQTIPTHILKRPNSQRNGYPRKDDEYGPMHRKPCKTFTFTVNCLRHLILKFLKIQFLKLLFAALLGQEHYIKTCKSLVNICLCAAYAQGSFSAWSDSWIFLPVVCRYW